MMKRINKNCIVFGFAVLFVAFGLSSREYFHSVLAGVKNFVIGKSIAEEMNTTVESSSKKLRYHDFLMDLNSNKENLLGTRVIIKDNQMIVKSDAGNLIYDTETISDDEIDDIVTRIDKVKDAATANGAEFLYCAASRKELYESAPENADNYFSENYTAFLMKMEEEGIPYLDYSEPFRRNHLDKNDLFFHTDTHWRPLVGFSATGSLCEVLHNRYGFDYYEEYNDINHYSVKTYPNWFLGNLGKKTGRYFSWYGADDFDL